MLSYLFLPGFSTSKAVTEISGRGLGLNILQNVLNEIQGTVQIFAKQGMTIQLRLPLSLSTIRALLVQISGETYAFPLVRIEAVLTVPKSSAKVFKFKDNEVRLIHASQFLELSPIETDSDFYSIVLLKNHANYYGLIVDCFLEERELVAQELDSRLGKITDISAGALMEDGTPVLILDIEDLFHSIKSKISNN